MLFTFAFCCSCKSSNRTTFGNVREVGVSRQFLQDKLSVWPCFCRWATEQHAKKPPERPDPRALCMGGPYVWAYVWTVYNAVEFTGTFANSQSANANKAFVYPSVSVPDFDKCILDSQVVQKWTISATRSKTGFLFARRIFYYSFMFLFLFKVGFGIYFWFCFVLFARVTCAQVSLQIYNVCSHTALFFCYFVFMLFCVFSLFILFACLLFCFTHHLPIMLVLCFVTSWPGPYLALAVPPCSPHPHLVQVPSLTLTISLRSPRPHLFRSVTLSSSSRDPQLVRVVTSLPPRHHIPSYSLTFPPGYMHVGWVIASVWVYVWVMARVLRLWACECMRVMVMSAWVYVCPMRMCECICEWWWWRVCVRVSHGQCSRRKFLQLRGVGTKYR